MRVAGVAIMGIRILFFFAIMMLDSVWAMDSEKTYLIKPLIKGGNKLIGGKATRAYVLTEAAP